MIKKNLQASIDFMRKHSKMSADLAQGQLDLLIATNASNAELREFGKDLDAANDVWRSKK